MQVTARVFSFRYDLETLEASWNFFNISRQREAAEEDFSDATDVSRTSKIEKKGKEK